ncbi:hypothetical protein [Caudoviricetes sp.]|nr:hypothetical protein [Caudoviricetes sp.]
MTSELTAIVGTGVAVGGVVVTFGVFAMRAWIAKDSKPMSDAMIALTGEVKALRDTIETERTDRKAERAETLAVFADLRKIVQDHDVTLAEHHVRLAQLEGPPPAATARKRKAA